jgi:hypothetical protein
MIGKKYLKSNEYMNVIIKALSKLGNFNVTQTYLKIRNTSINVSFFISIFTNIGGSGLPNFGKKWLRDNVSATYFLVGPRECFLVCHGFYTS